MTRLHKAFFALILLEAVPVAVLGYFFPSRLDTAFSWMTLPPLHARFVASLYFFGVVFMLGCLLARDWVDVRLAIPLAVIWTGLLFIVSVIHLDDFDFDKIPVWIWMIAYFLDPLIGLAIMWQARGRWKLSAGKLPSWIRAFLSIQGGVFAILALALLVIPGEAVKVWPWGLGSTLAQYYAGPMLAYGVGSLLFGWQGTWSQIRIATPAMLTFTAATLIASIIHSELFSSDLSDILWFAGFGIAAAGNAYLTAKAFIWT
jgi:hypothetical protein